MGQKIVTQSEQTGAEQGRAWTIEITAGVNAGATVPLDAGSYTLGGHLSNDIVFSDPAIADRQVQLDIGPDGARVTPLTAGVSRRHRALEPGRTMALRPGARLQFGQTQIRLDGPRAPMRHLGWVKASAALLLLGGGFAAVFHVAAPVAMATSKTIAVQTPPRTAADPAVVQRDLQEHLAGVGLGGLVTLAASGRAMTATGALLAGDRETWLAAQQWFDGRYGSDTVLIDRVGVAAKQDLPKLDIAAVALLPIPHLVTRDGEHYIKGAVLPDGWSISAITGRAVTLTRGSRSIDVAL